MTDPIDVIELLERDHRLINGLVEQLDEVDDATEIRHLYLRIVEELSAHEAVEQAVLFPAFRAAFASSGSAARATMPEPSTMASISSSENISGGRVKPGRST